MDRCVNIYQFIGFGQWFGGMFKAVEGKWLEIDDKEICKSYVNNFSEWAQNIKIFVSHVNVHKEKLSQQNRILSLSD